MPEFYFGTDSNKIGEVKTNDKTGKLVRVSLFPSAPNTYKMKDGVSTQVVVSHPTLPLVISLTSFWNAHPSHLTCFETKEGDLAEVTGSDMPGREACHAMFYPKDNNQNKVTLACAHLHDGTVAFFQFSAKEIPKSLDDQPAMTIALPLLEAGTRRTLGTGKGLTSVPSSVHVFYAPNGNYLLVVDPNQSCIFTFQVDETGLPSSDQPSATFKCHTDAPSLGWFSKIVNKIRGYSSCQPRRVAISPNDKYVFVSYEYQNVIQVYHIDQYGKIDPEQKGCMQEVSTIDAALTSKKLIGLTFQASAECKVFGNSLYVSNRGDKVVAGKSENSIRIFDIRDGGRLASQHAVHCSGPVRHFCVYEKDGYDILIAGTTKPGMSLQTFQRKQGEESSQFELVGEADVGVSIFSVAPGSV